MGKSLFRLVPKLVPLNDVGYWRTGRYIALVHWIW